MPRAGTGRFLDRTEQRRVRIASLLCLGLGLLVGCDDDVNPSGLFVRDATLQQLASGFAFTEGPAADAEGNVYFTDQPNDRIWKWATDGTLTTFMEGAGRSNGLFVDADGNLVTCADENSHLWRISMDGQIEPLLTGVDGKRFNGPNDLWITPAGGIYFTDPYYQRDYWARTGPELDNENVYYLAPDGTLVIVDDNLVKPNGIVGDPAGNLLYVADIGAGKTYVYQRQADGRLSDRREFISMGSDGMTLDSNGNVYLTGDGVTVFSPEGDKLTHIEVDEPWTANVTFGGANRDLLFITASTSVYALQMNARGAR
jgi:gluconolactonase